jgi:flagellar hook protein FlgE
MSIYGAMFSGVSGLNANSQALGAIADNITNVNTIGYKATEVRFQTLVTAQAGLNNYSPGGVQQRPFSAVDVQGLFQSSSNSTDLGISGDGFFVVNQNAVNDGATGFDFTRAGAFNADKSGYLRNTAGFYLQGYRTNSLGQTVDSNNNSFNPDPTVFTNLETIRLNNIGGTANATEKLTFGANLPAEAANGDTRNTTIQVYDSLGVAHNVSLVWTKTSNNNWDLGVAPPTGAATTTLADSSGNVYASTGQLDFASTPADGDLISFTFANSAGGTTTKTYEFNSAGATSNGGIAVAFASGNGASGAAAALVAVLQGTTGSGDVAITLSQSTGNARFQLDSTGTKIDIFQTVVAGTGTDANALDISIDASGTSAISQSGAGTFTVRNLDLNPSSTSAVTFDGSGIPTAFNAASIDMDLSNGAADMAIDFDFGHVGQADGLVQFAAPYNPTFIDTDGAAFGQFSGVTIGTDGLVTALFENGDIRPIFKIPVATFPNPDGLGINTGNVYNQTDFSGLFFLRTAGTGGAGTIQSSVLESSTVDIAKEFTNMITTQRAYSASAKIISTADQMLDELVHIKN